MATIAIWILVLVALSGCTESGGLPERVPFADHVGCQLQFPDGRPVDCQGTAAPFSDTDHPAWLCAWEFRVREGTGSLLQSPDLSMGAVRITGATVPPAKTWLVMTIQTDDAEFTHAGPWVSSDQLFVFPNPVDQDNWNFRVMAVSDWNATWNGQDIQFDTIWTSFEGTPSPITRVEPSNRQFHFQQFVAFELAEESSLVPDFSFTTLDGQDNFTVERRITLDASTPVAGVGRLWGGVCNLQATNVMPDDPSVVSWP